MENKASPSPSIKNMFSSFIVNRELILQLTKREVISRYRGSVIGLAWSLFNPLLMLGVYTFVFSVVFEAKWGVDTDEGKGKFAVVLFAGMIVFNLFAECFNRAPALIVSNVNYVKKVVFPLDILCWVLLGSAIFHALVSLVVLLAAELLIFGGIPVTSLWMPIILLPYFFAILGMSWFLAASGVYIRDINQITGVLTTVLMFTSPLFFPLSALPESIQPWLMLNPLAYFIEEIRAVLVWGEHPGWRGQLAAYILGIGAAWAGYAWFQKTRKGFADVL